MTTNLPACAISVIGQNAVAFVSCLTGIGFFEPPIETLLIESIISARANRAQNLICCLLTVHIKTDLCIAAFVAAVTSSNRVCLLCDDGIEDLLSFWKSVFHWLDHNSAISHLTFLAHSVQVIIIRHFVCDVQDWVEILHWQLDCVDSPLITSLIQSRVIELREIQPPLFFWQISYRLRFDFQNGLTQLWNHFMLSESHQPSFDVQLTTLPPYANWRIRFKRYFQGSERLTILHLKERT
jgi:hypothetical protein